MHIQSKGTQTNNIESVNLSRKEVAKLIGISVSKIDQMIRAKTIPTFKIDGRRFFKRDEILEWNSKRASQTTLQVSKAG
ncbi:MAG: hypothetical protein CMJ19_15225 [Phycisphaeraceae bacterium]|nr:hypothetical protein [Phycisphaeraceae bacterium]|tara:strand:- start:399 stop:635 length:237 start_codon:yes stop_codon:yes gene_type:complete